MDEQLEVAFEGAGMEDRSEAPVSPGSEAAPDARKAASACAPPAPSELNDEAHILPPLPKGGMSAELTGGIHNTGVPRNHYAEWQELAEAHPELVGKELPEDIYQECMRSELPPLRVYESMMLRKQAEQISALRQEIATLRQNAENTARAPVSASAGSPENEPEDQFMQGFNSY